MPKNLGVATAIYTDQEYTRSIYHNTPVVSFNRDKIILNSGGWMTSTTKKRMNQVAEMFNLKYQVYQKDYNWYIDYKGQTFDFYDGFILSREGVNHE